MLHPAAALRGNEAMRMFEQTFKKLPAALGKVKKGGEDEPLPQARSEKKQKIEDVQAKLF